MGLLRREKKQTSDVFGVAPEVLKDSYVDRGDLDATLRRMLSRKSHIALRGESKCGKSWLRRSIIPDAVVVQCRLGMTTVDVYRDALSQLGIQLMVESKEGDKLTGRVEATAEVGNSIFAKLGLKSSVEGATESGETFKPVGRDLTDLNFIADIPCFGTPVGN